MSRGPLWSERDLMRAVELNAAGWTHREIAAEVGRSKEAVEARIQKYNRENRFGFLEADIRAASAKFAALPLSLSA